MKPTTMTRARAMQLLAAFTVLIVVGLAFALRPQPAQAATPARSYAAPFGAIVAQGILADTYEPNDNVNAARSLSLLACTSPIAISELTVNPNSDVDYFRLNPTTNITFEVRVAAQTPLAGNPNDLRLVIELLDVNQASITTNQTDPGGSLTLSYRPPNANAVFVKIGAPNVANGQFKPYAVTVCNTTSTSQATPTPASASPDVYEPNENPHAVLNPESGIIRSFLNVGSTFANTQQPNFYGAGIPLGYIQASGDVDWYFFYGRYGARYRLTTSTQPGVDTEMFLFRENPALLDKNFNNSDGTGQMTYNDDYQAGDRGSRIEFTGDYDGRYWLKIWNKDPGPRSGAPGYNPSYNVAVQELVGPLTGTATPGPTPYPQGADRFEYNGDWDTAVLIAPNAKYDNLNFVPFEPPTRDTIDNDFFRMPVKQGVYYTCETLDLSAGTDTNLIVFNQNAPQNRDASLIAGNDNISMAEASRGNFASRVSWLSNYTGIAYLLVGDVTPPRANEALARSYSLQCTIGLPTPPTETPDPNPSATPAPAEPFVPPTAEPPDPTMTPYPTPKASQNLVVRPADPAAPVLPTPTNVPQLSTMTVFVFVDRNRNGAADPGEGIENTAVHIVDETGTPLRWLRTNADGRALFLEVSISAPVRISVPYFGYNVVAEDPRQVLNIAVNAGPELPDVLP